MSSGRAKSRVAGYRGRWLPAPSYPRRAPQCGHTKGRPQALLWVMADAIDLVWVHYELHQMLNVKGV